MHNVVGALRQVEGLFLVSGSRKCISAELEASPGSDEVKQMLWDRQTVRMARLSPCRSAGLF